MPTPATELAAANRTLSIARFLFGRRKRLRNQRHDLETLYGEVTANLNAVRAVFKGGAFDRWAWRATSLSTVTWRRLAYPLTNLVDGPLIDRDLAVELDSLAADFERARQQTLFSSDWEPRLLAAAFALRELIAHHPRHQWDRLFLRRPGADFLPAPDTTVITPKTPAELQRRALERMGALERQRR